MTNEGSDPFTVFFFWRQRDRFLQREHEGAWCNGTATFLNKVGPGGKHHCMYVTTQGSVLVPPAPGEVLRQNYDRSV
jgi:hypothetical protein